MSSNILFVMHPWFSMGASSIRGVLGLIILTFRAPFEALSKNHAPILAHMRAKNGAQSPLYCDKSTHFTSVKAQYEILCVRGGRRGHVKTRDVLLLIKKISEFAPAQSEVGCKKKIREMDFIPRATIRVSVENCVFSFNDS